VVFVKFVVVVVVLYCHCKAVRYTGMLFVANTVKSVTDGRPVIEMIGAAETFSCRVLDGYDAMGTPVVSVTLKQY